MKFLETLIPPPIVFLVFAVLMWLLNGFYAIGVFIDRPWNLFGFVFIAVTGLFAGSAFLSFRRAKTTTNPRKIQLASRLVTTGVFGFSRNPMYLGLLLLLAGWGVFLGGMSVWIMPPLFLIYISIFQIAPEERFLTKKFGASYKKYKKTVGRWSPFF